MNKRQRKKMLKKRHTTDFRMHETIGAAYANLDGVARLEFVSNMEFFKDQMLTAMGVPKHIMEEER